MRKDGNNIPDHVKHLLERKIDLSGNLTFSERNAKSHAAIPVQEKQEEREKEKERERKN